MTTHRTDGTIDVAVVGLGFGSDFVPIYQAHPGVGRIAIVDPDAARCAEVGDRYGIEHRFTDLDDLLAGEGWDAVHVLSPVRFHADHVIAVLESGRHCACAVPMATELADLERIIAAARTTGRRYMMMETAVFAREFFYARDLLQRGELGDLTFFRGAHVQDLDRFPEYWQGYPPMKYLTHALSPALALAGARVRDVRCLGAGPAPVNSFDNPFGLETGLFTLDPSGRPVRLIRSDSPEVATGLIAEITVGFFSMARSFYEGFSVYGTLGSVEWPQLESDAPVTFRYAEPGPGERHRRVDVGRIEPPDRPDLLPAELASFVRAGVYHPPGGLPGVELGSHHGGSHPHLVHEFVDAILGDRPPLVDELTAADWTAPGICAHESALRGGDVVAVPRFT